MTSLPVDPFFAPLNPAAPAESIAQVSAPVTPAPTPAPVPAPVVTAAPTTVQAPIGSLIVDPNAVA